jgi:hypothetical protein
MQNNESNHNVPDSTGFNVDYVHESMLDLWSEFIFIHTYISSLLGTQKAFFQSFGSLHVTDGGLSLSLVLNVMPIGDILRIEHIIKTALDVFEIIHKFFHSTLHDLIAGAQNSINLSPC